MESLGNPDPTQREAREALGLADKADSAVRNPVLPAWFFAAMAVLVAAVLLAQMLDTTQRSTVMFGAVAIALLLNMTVQNKRGVSFAAFRFRDLAPFLVTVLVVIGGTAVAYAVTEEDWVWAVGAGLAAIVVLVTGAAYRRRTA